MASSVANAQTLLAQAAAARVGGHLLANPGRFFEPPPRWTINTAAETVSTTRFRPHRHWAWLFPNASTASALSDPIGLRHGWRDPLLRRDWWR